MLRAADRPSPERRGEGRPHRVPQGWGGPGGGNPRRAGQEGGALRRVCAEAEHRHPPECHDGDECRGGLVTLRPKANVSMVRHSSEALIGMIV